MGQYYLPFVKRDNKVVVFDNKVDGEWTGLKLMEHSYWRNTYVGNVINEIYYNKAHVCWVGDYYDEDDYYQVNCEDKAIVKAIGQRVWDEKTKRRECTIKNSRSLTDNLLVNHTKKVFINGNEFYKLNEWVETWEGKDYHCCINPLPLLTCSASHSGGSYYGINREDCGTWFNDELEVVEDYEENELIKNGYLKVDYEFKE